MFSMCWMKAYRPVCYNRKEIEVLAHLVVVTCYMKKMSNYFTEKIETPSLGKLL